MQTLELGILVDDVTLAATLEIPDTARAIVVFAHGSGSSRFSPRNRKVAAGLHSMCLVTLFFDLLTPDEQRHDSIDATFRFS